jgi:hypothetical protein
MSTTIRVVRGKAPDGKKGRKHATVDIAADGYQVDVQDLTPEQAADAIAQIKERHDVRIARTAGLRVAVHNRLTSAGGRVWSVIGAGVNQRGTDVEVMLAVASDAGESVILRRAYPGVEEVPGDEELWAMLMADVDRFIAAKKAASEYDEALYEALRLRGIV